MDLLGAAQSKVTLVLALAIIAMQAFAFVDALRHRPEAYLAAGKRTKSFWLAITGAAVLVGFVTMLDPLRFVALIGIIAAGVYLADVRPALKAASGGPQRRHDTW